MATAKLANTPPIPRRKYELCRIKARSNSTDAVEPRTLHKDKFERYVLFRTDRGNGTGLYLLGAGNFGNVYMARDTKDDTSVALKIFKQGDRGVTRREVSTMMRLSHPNIVVMLDSFIHGGKMHIVYELLRHGDLYEWMTGQYHHGKLHAPVIPDSTTIAIARQVAQALAYCHGMGVAHRDLKPENILVAHLFPQIEIKVLDFGMSYVITNGMPRYTNERVGSKEYAAPEIFYGARELDPFLCDSWSYGVVLYTLLHYYYPFSLKELHKLVPGGSLGPLDIGRHVNDNLRAVLKSTLVLDPGERETIQNIASGTLLDNLPECVEEVRCGDGETVPTLNGEDRRILRTYLSDTSSSYDTVHTYDISSLSSSFTEVSDNEKENAQEDVQSVRDGNCCC
jgi:serine/threonine protein kinase